MKLLNLDRAEENLLHWLVQCCLSDKLLYKSGLPPDLADGQYLETVRTLDAKLKELWAREHPGEAPDCGERIGEVPGYGTIYCTRPAGHPPGSSGGPGHFGEIRRGSGE